MIPRETVGFPFAVSHFSKAKTNLNLAWVSSAFPLPQPCALKLRQELGFCEQERRENLLPQSVISFFLHGRREGRRIGPPENQSPYFFKKEEKQAPSVFESICMRGLACLFPHLFSLSGPCACAYRTMMPKNERLMTTCHWHPATPPHPGTGIQGAHKQGGQLRGGPLKFSSVITELSTLAQVIHFLYLVFGILSQITQ